MAERAIWEVYAGQRLIGHVGWLGGRQILVDLDERLRALLRSWFSAHLGPLTDVEVKVGLVDAFLTREVPARLEGARMRRVDPDTLPPGVWLGVLEPDRLVRGQVDHGGSRSNRWPIPLELPELIVGTVEQRYRWTRGARGGFKAGGIRGEDEELWLHLIRHRADYTLVVRRNGALEKSPYRQRKGWVLRAPLQRLYAWLDARL